MVIYICEKCHKKFNHKGNYEKHVNKKNPCVTIEDDSNNKIDAKIDKLIKKVDDLEKSNKELENSNKKLVNRIFKLETKHNVTFNADTINIVNMVAHGSEDLSFLTETDQKKLVMLGFKSIPKFVEMVHCNNNKPEYKNVYISSKKNMNKVMAYDGEKWKLCSSNIVDDLYDRGIDYIEGQFDELKEREKIPQTAIKRLEKVFEQLTGEDGDDKKRKINEDIKLILYNNRPN